MFMSSVLLGLMLVTAQAGDSMPSSVSIENCFLTPVDEANVAAEEAGAMIKLPVKEGQFVKKGELLAQIDDGIPQMELRVAEYKYTAAEEQAKNDVTTRYAKAAYDVAWAEYQAAVDANSRVPGSKPQAVILELLLKTKETSLGIEKSKVDLRIAGLQAKVSEAEADQAREKVERRRVTSPLDGQVQKINPHVGEWVQAGDTVMHVIQVSQLHIDGRLNVADFSPGEINGRPVTVKVQLARGHEVSINGKIEFVDPTVRQNGEYNVRAVIQNREEKGEWLLRPGLKSEMIIQLK